MDTFTFVFHEMSELLSVIRFQFFSLPELLQASPLCCAKKVHKHIFGGRVFALQILLGVTPCQNPRNPTFPSRVFDSHSVLAPAPAKIYAGAARKCRSGGHCTQTVRLRGRSNQGAQATDGTLNRESQTHHWWKGEMLPSIPFVVWAKDDHQRCFDQG